MHKISKLIPSKSATIIIGYLISTILFGCNPSKKYVEQGDKQYQLGNYEEAANYYYNALLAKRDNIVAQQGLKKAGNNVLTSKFTLFAKKAIENNSAEAVKQYLSNRKYFRKIESVGVELDWPTMYDDVYEDLKNEYIGKLYDEGLQLMKQNKYDKAEATFSKIAEIDSSYKDVSVLRMTSIMEPLYDRGLSNMNTQNYKEAFRNFEKVVAYDATYKNAKVLKEEALVKATISIGILSINTRLKIREFDQKLYQYLLTEMVKTKGPFIKIVDRNYIEKMLNEQQLGMSGAIDPVSAAKAGKLLGLKYFLLANVNDSKYSEKNTKQDSVLAYESYTESIPDPVNGTYQHLTKFKKVYYSESFQQKSYYLSVFYQLISTETAEVITSNIFNLTKNDEQQLNIYNGNVKNLYRDLPAGNYTPPEQNEWRKQFNVARRILMSKEDLEAKSYIELSKKISEEVRLYIEK